MTQPTTKTDFAAAAPAAASPEDSARRTEAARISGGKRATWLSFFIAGFGFASWAPLVPFAQERTQADAAMLGTVLLCLGLGAIIGMPTAGAMSNRIGSRVVIIAGSVGMIVALPLLALLSTPLSLGLCLLLFGASIGAIDVAANIHGNDVQNAAGVPLMSGFHALYSVGGLIGASGMTALIASGMAVDVAAGIVAFLIAVCIVVATPGFFRSQSTGDHSLLVLPRGLVIVIGILALITFLVEGAMLDWGALLLIQAKRVEVAHAGAAYTVFAVAMTISRLVGDRVVARIGERPMLILGLCITGLGFALAAFFQSLMMVLAGIAIAGLAVGNVVPILFTLAGRQTVMPAAHAIAAASILGYLGVLMGPALIGYVAHFTGLAPAFYGLGFLMLASALGWALAVPAQRQSL